MTNPNGNGDEVKQEDSRVAALQKELQKELNVKEGLERFFKSDRNPSAYNFKWQENSKQLYEDNKAKISFLRMQIERLQLQEHATSNNGGELGPFATCVNYYIRFSQLPIEIRRYR